MKNIILYPGGFKPPHIGHLTLANKFADNCDELIIFIGSKPREEISQDMSYNIWTILPVKKNIKIIKSVKNTPYIDLYDYVFSLNEPTKVTLAYSSKEDDNLCGKFINSVNKCKITPTKDGKLINENVIPDKILFDCPITYSNRTDEYNDQPISATILRNDLRNNDFENFKTNYIGLSDNIIEQIYLLLKYL